MQQAGGVGMGIQRAFKFVIPFVHTLQHPVSSAPFCDVFARADVLFAFLFDHFPEHPDRTEIDFWMAESLLRHKLSLLFEHDATSYCSFSGTGSGSGIREPLCRVSAFLRLFVLRGLVHTRQQQQVLELANNCERLLFLSQIAITPPPPPSSCSSSSSSSIKKVASHKSRSSTSNRRRNTSAGGAGGALGGAFGIVGSFLQDVTAELATAGTKIKGLVGGAAGNSVGWLLSEEAGSYVAGAQASSQEESCAEMTNDDDDDEGLGPPISVGAVVAAGVSFEAFGMMMTLASHSDGGGGGGGGGYAGGGDEEDEGVEMRTELDALPASENEGAWFQNSRKLMSMSNEKFGYTSSSSSSYSTGTRAFASSSSSSSTSSSTRASAWSTPMQLDDASSACQVEGRERGFWGSK